MGLSEEEVWLFRHNGFLVAPGPLPDELVGRLDEEANRQIADRVEPLVWKKARGEGSRSFVNRISDLLQRSPLFLEAATHDAVLNPLESILGPNIYLLSNWHNHMMVRPPGSPRIKWHRGAPLFAPTLMTVLIYLAESTVDNGCIRVVPGSHVSPFGDPMYLVDEETREAAKRVAFEEHDLYRLSVPVPMPRGGVLLMNDAVFHGAAENRGDADRRSMTLAFMGHDDHATAGVDQARIRVRGAGIYRGLNQEAGDDIANALSQLTSKPQA
jgi:phytanoyl-CoA hydroxylase